MCGTSTEAARLSACWLYFLLIFTRLLIFFNGTYHPIGHYNMMTSSNGYIFRVTGRLCGEFTGHRWSPPQRPVKRSFDIFFDLRLNGRLNKESWAWWFETPYSAHYDVTIKIWATIQVPRRVVKFLFLIGSATCRWNLLEPDLQMKCVTNA